MLSEGLVAINPEDKISDRNHDHNSSPDYIPPIHALHPPSRRTRTPDQRNRATPRYRLAVRIQQTPHLVSGFLDSPRRHCESGNVVTSIALRSGRRELSARIFAWR